MDISTADLFDSYHDRIQVCDLQFRNYGAKSAFFGECVTLTAFEDHHPVIEALKAEGRGRVLVVDGGGSLCVGIIGDGAAAIAIKNGWVGAIIFGAIRDSVAVKNMDFGLKALGTTARRSHSRTAGILGKPVEFGSALFATGSWVYADPDAVIVSGSKL
jgi:regulator of ribonuclease activity A